MHRSLTVLLASATAGLMALTAVGASGADASASVAKPVTSSWYGTFTATMTYDQTQTDGAVSTLSTGSVTVSFTAAQTITKPAIHMVATGKSVTDDGAGCVETQTSNDDVTGAPPHVDGAFVDHIGAHWTLQPASFTPPGPFHTSMGAGCPYGPSESDNTENDTQSPLLQVPIKVVKTKTGLRAQGSGKLTKASLDGADYTGWYPGGFDHFAGTYSYNLTFGPTPKKLLDYSLAGVCGRVNISGNSSAERCYLMLGAATIRAIKKHEKSFAGVVATASQKALGAAAGKVAIDFAENKAKGELVSYAIKKLAGSAVETAYSGFSFGQLVGKITTIAIIAQRWEDLEAPGYPHKCFVFQATYGKGKASLSLDPIWSFVRSWDSAHPPARPKSTSFAHWDSSQGDGATLPMFCSGAGAKATVVAPTSGLSDLLSPPYVRFSVDFNH